MKKKILILVVSAVFLIIVLSGCITLEPVTVRGGGWLPYYGMVPENSIGPVGKATFGFTVECYNAVFDEVEETWEFDVRGQFLYIDHHNGVRIKGPVLAATYLDGGGVFAGECTFDGMPATFTVGVYDEGEPGTEDMFGITVTVGTGEVYSNAGPLGGGNIQMFYPE